MSLRVYFSSSAKVTAPPEWVHGIADAGFDGWEVVAEGDYRLDDPAGLARVRDLVETTGLAVSVHAPYADLNLGSLNFPILRESVRQVTSLHRGGLRVDRPGHGPPRVPLAPRKARPRAGLGHAERGAQRESAGAPPTTACSPASRT